MHVPTLHSILLDRSMLSLYGSTMHVVKLARSLMSNHAGLRYSQLSSHGCILKTFIPICSTIYKAGNRAWAMNLALLHDDVWAIFFLLSVSIA